MVVGSSPTMTDIEEKVRQWLIRHKIDFQFQSSLMGGFFALGGAVVDFLLPFRQLAFRVHGEYWHSGVIIKGRDAIQKEMLGTLGWNVIDLWGDDIEDKLDETMLRALRGEGMLR